MNAIATVTAFTHQGLVREFNEDALAVNAWVRNAPMECPRTWSFDLTEPLLCVIADGLGGHAAGDVASRRAALSLSATPRLSSPEAAAARLNEINVEIYEAMEAAPERRKMGTTVVGLCACEGRFVWFNVGDSRLYRISDGYLRQISIDDAVEQGVGRVHYGVTQALGGALRFTPIDPHTGATPLFVPSRWLLCSDGLSDMVEPYCMEACLADDDASASQALFEHAMTAGGHDNLSIIIVSTDEKEHADGGRDDPGA